MPGIMRLRRSNKDHLTREHVRRYLQHRREKPEPNGPPQRLRKDVAIQSGREHDWLIHRITPLSTAPRGTVVYLHGGGWMNEAAIQHWQLVSRIAAEASVEVVLPVYPLVQAGGTAETVTPIVAEIAAASARPLVMMGDSAGGTIALSTGLMLTEQGSAPDLTVLISPALDMRMENPQIDEVQPFDPWLVKKGQLEVTEMWIGEHGEDPILNPFLGDVRNAGRIVLYSGTRDLLNPDTRLFVDRAVADGADIEYHELPGHIHVYPLLPIPEGRAARRSIVEEIRRAVRTP